MSAVSTTVTDLPDSRVKVEAEVTPKAVEQAMLETAKVLSRDLRMPGFRQGKVPPPVVIRRYGREAVLDEALRQSMGTWLVEAVEDAGLKTVGEPQVNIGEMPAAGKPLTFEFEISVRPRPSSATSIRSRSAVASPPLTPSASRPTSSSCASSTPS